MGARLVEEQVLLVMVKVMVVMAVEVVEDSLVVRVDRVVLVVPLVLVRCTTDEHHSESHP